MAERELEPQLCMPVVHSDPAPWVQDKDCLYFPLLHWRRGALFFWRRPQFSAGWIVRDYILSGSKVGLLETLSHNLWIPFISARATFRSRELDGTYFVSSLIYCCICSSNSNHCLLFCLPLHLHQGVVEKRTQPGIRPASCWLTAFLGNFAPAF